MVEFEWPRSDVRPKVQVVGAGSYLALYSMFVGDASGIDVPTEEVIDGIESMGDVAQLQGSQFARTDADQAVVDGFLELLEAVESAGGDPFRAFATEERTEWAVFCLSISDAVAESVGDPAAVDGGTLETVFDAGVAWLREKDSPPGEATDAEWEQFRSRLTPDVRDDLVRSDVAIFGDTGANSSNAGDALSLSGDEGGGLADDAADRGGGPDPTSHDFGRHVDPLSVRDTAVEIAADHPSSGSNPTLQQICAVHRYVRDEVNYVSDPRGTNYVAPPNRTLEVGGGDCDDQGVLVASLCEAIGATTRVAVVVSTDGSGHLFPQVRMGDASAVSVDAIRTGVGQFYDAFVTGILYTEDDHDGLWVPADPTMGQYFGDPSGYEQRGFFVDDSWHRVEYYYPD